VAGSDRNQDAWTAGRESKCAGKFEWCSTKLFFPLRDGLFWRNEPDALSQKHNETCLFVEFGGIQSKFEAKLGKSECSTEKKIICEVSFYYKYSCGHQNKNNSSQGPEQWILAGR